MLPPTASCRHQTKLLQIVGTLACVHVKELPIDLNAKTGLFSGMVPSRFVQKVGFYRKAVTVALRRHGTENSRNFMRRSTVKKPMSPRKATTLVLQNTIVDKVSFFLCLDWTITLVHVAAL